MDITTTQNFSNELEQEFGNTKIRVAISVENAPLINNSHDCIIKMIDRLYNAVLMQYTTRN